MRARCCLAQPRPCPVCAGVAGVGIGLSSVASTTIGTDVCDRIQGAAAGILNACAQLGTAIGVSAAVLLAAATQHLPLRGAALSWTVAAVLAVGGAVLALRRLHSGDTLVRGSHR
jgi:MFS family permease